MKIWVSGNDVIEHNSQQETIDELYGTGYLARLKEFIARREAALKEEDTRKKLRRKQLEEARRRTEEEEAEEEEL